MITLAVLTGVPMDQWVEWGEEAIVTAWDVLRGRGRQDDEGRQMSG